MTEQTQTEATGAARASELTGGAARTLERLGLVAGHSAVVGLQWGDEGKGQIVDLLTRCFDYVVRYNGGNNAGHSVHIGDQKFALHLIPSGIMYPEPVNVIGNGVVVDPPGLLSEVDGLRERGVKIAENLRISDRSHVVLPYHKVQDRLYEAAVSRAAGDARKIGTTGRGIGPCYADKALRSRAVLMSELVQPAILRERLGHIVAVKNLMLGALAEACGESFEAFDAEALAEEYGGYGERIRPHVCDTTELLHGALSGGSRVLFEGANANLLDVDHGTYPFVTSSNCSSLGIYPGTGVPGGVAQNVVGICKLYTSRVGGGPFPTELHDAVGERIRESGGEYGTTTGRPRRCGWLDLVAIRYACRISGATALACTGLAVLAGQAELKVCVGYRLGGVTTTRFPGDAAELERAEPVYETLSGFEQDIGGCGSYGELPAAARRYVEFVESFVGVPIRMVCVGRRRDQILVR